MFKTALATLILLGGLNDLTADQRTDWMKDGKWGVMTHYLADLKAESDHIEMTPAKWNELIDHFDTEALARQLKEAGAAWYQITIGQNSGYYLAPNATYEGIVHEPGKCSQRDLISDLYRSLHRRNIRLLVYLPSGAPDEDAKAISALDWRKGSYPNREFQTKWEAVIREWSLRWGEKISGWWFDGCYFADAMYRSPQPPNFASFAAAARAGNANALLAFNPGVNYSIISLTSEEDFTAGEIDIPEKLSIRPGSDGRVDGAQLQVLSYLGQTWGVGKPRFSADQAVSYSRKVWDQHGVVTWDVPSQLDGKLSPASLPLLRAIGKAAQKIH